MDHSCCFSLGGNLDFLDFLQKKFYNIDYWLKPFPLCIAGLTGRKLKLPNDIVNPSDKFRIGVKRAINLYPKPLAERIVKERLEKDWEPSHKLVLAQVMRP